MPIHNDYQPIIAVFRHGLVWGLIDKEWVKHWAEGILNTEERPDYFFVELSAAGSVEEMVLSINRELIWDYAPLFARVLMGMLCRELQNGQIAATRAHAILMEILAMDVLCRGEDDYLYQIEFEERFDLKDGDARLTVDLLGFLATYRDLGLHNIVDWWAINQVIHKHFAVIEQQREERYEQLGKNRHS
jgi:hypothetical protein